MPGTLEHTRRREGEGGPGGGASLLRLPAAVLVACALASLTGCGRGSDAGDASLALNVDVRADTAATTLPVARVRPAARIWVSSISPLRPSPLDLELPDASSDTLIREGPPPPLLQIDDDLKPPILRHRAVLRVPGRYGGELRSVELDVRVDATGVVTDALWTGGSDDSTLVQAATECALRMSFFPALQAGRAVPVWCRQRFDFGSRRRR